MKKAIILCMLIIGMMADAQNQITTKPLQLNTVNKGFASDSVLVWGKDKIVKFMPKSEFSSGITPNIDQVLGAGYLATDKAIILRYSDISTPLISGLGPGIFQMQNNTNPSIHKEIFLDPTTLSIFNGKGNDEFIRIKKDSIIFSDRSDDGRESKATVRREPITNGLANDIETDIILPQTDGTFYLPLSVNGISADSSGNIAIEGGAQNFEQILTEGNTTTKDFYQIFSDQGVSVKNGIFRSDLPYDNYTAINGTELNIDGVTKQNIGFQVGEGAAYIRAQGQGAPFDYNLMFKFPIEKPNPNHPFKKTYTLATTDDLAAMVTTNGTVTGTQTLKLESNDHITSTYMKNNEIGSQSSSGKVYLRNNALSFSAGGSCIQLSTSPTQRSSTQIFVTMPDTNGQLALRDEFAYDSSATTAVSATNLDADFANAPNGFKVRTHIVDPSDASKFIMYEKTSTGWIEYSFKTVTP